jgi:hypothetical protein
MPFFERVLEADEGSRRAAVKLLTHTIETRLVELTINAPDWSVNASRLPEYLLVLLASIQGHIVCSPHGKRPPLGRREVARP